MKHHNVLQNSIKRLLLSGIALALVGALTLPATTTRAQGDDEEERTVFMWAEYGLSFLYPAAWGQRLDADGYLVISTDPSVLESFVDPTELALVIAVLPPTEIVFSALASTELVDFAASATPDAPPLPTEMPTESPTETPTESATETPTEAETDVVIDDDPEAIALADFETFILANEFFEPDTIPSEINVTLTGYGLLGVAVGPEDDPLHQQIAVIGDTQVSFLLRLYDPNNSVTPDDFLALLDTVLLSGAIVPLATVEPLTPFADDALPLVVGEDVRGELDEETEFIYYSFEATAGQYVTIQMIADDELELDPTIYLYADDNEIAYNDDGIPGTLHSRLTNVQLPPADRYVIEASKYDGAGSYTLRVDISDSPDIDLILDDSVASGELLYGNRITDTLERSTQTRYYTFTASAGDDVLILMQANNPEQLDTILTLYDATGVVVAENDDQGVGNRNSRIEVLLPNAGTYYIVASSFFGSGVYELLLELQ